MVGCSIELHDMGTRAELMEPTDLGSGPVTIYFSCRLSHLASLSPQFHLRNGDSELCCEQDRLLRMIPGGAARCAGEPQRRRALLPHKHLFPCQPSPDHCSQRKRASHLSFPSQAQDPPAQHHLQQRERTVRLEETRETSSLLYRQRSLLAFVNYVHHRKIRQREKSHLNFHSTEISMIKTLVQNFFPDVYALT